MRVSVKFAGPLRAAAGVKEASVELRDGADTGEALVETARRFPGIQRELFGEDAKTYYSLFINDKLVAETERLRAPLRNDDEVLLLLPVAGG